MTSIPAGSDPFYNIRLVLLKQINKERKERGLNEVELDPLATRVADAHSKEMAEHKYLSHWNQFGHKPYHRYALAGGRDHVAENVACMSVYGSSKMRSEKELCDVILHLHAEFMAEVPPNDGHKLNILNPGHTHVGLGIYQSSPFVCMLFLLLIVFRCLS